MISFRRFPDGPVREPVLENDPVNMAYALQASYYSYFTLRNQNESELRALLGQFDLVIAAIDREDYSICLRVIKASPVTMIGYSEGHIWDYQLESPLRQRDFVEALNHVALNLIYWDKYLGFYRMLSTKPVEYMPYPYLVEYVQNLATPRIAPQKIIAVPTGLYGSTRNGLVAVSVVKRLLEQRQDIRVVFFADMTNYEQDSAAIRDLIAGQFPSHPERFWKAQLRQRLLSRKTDYRWLLRFRNRFIPARPAEIAFASRERCQVVRTRGWKSYIQLVKDGYLMIDPNNRETVGRNALDCAALGIPCVAAGHTDLQAKLFPETTVDHAWDVDAMVATAHRLLDDRALYEHVVEYAQNTVTQYGVDAFRERFRSMVAKFGLDG